MHADDWVPAAELSEMLGLPVAALNRGRRWGILQEGVHYLRPEGRNRYLYHRVRLRPLVADLRAAKGHWGRRWQRLARRHDSPVSTERKQELLIQLNTTWVEVRDLERQYLDACRRLDTLQREYWWTRWLRRDCPYCRGTGKVGSSDCIFCGDVLRLE